MNMKIKWVSFVPENVADLHLQCRSLMDMSGAATVTDDPERRQRTRKEGKLYFPRTSLWKGRKCWMISFPCFCILDVRHNFANCSKYIRRRKETGRRRMKDGKLFSRKVFLPSSTSPLFDRFVTFLCEREEQRSESWLLVRNFRRTLFLSKMSKFHKFKFFVRKPQPNYQTEKCLISSASRICSSEIFDSSAHRFCTERRICRNSAQLTSGKRQRVLFYFPPLLWFSLFIWLSDAT